MSQTILSAVTNCVNNSNAPHQQRAFAVAAALEVIAARAPSMSASGQLEHEMAKLSRYADLIQEALAAE